MRWRAKTKRRLPKGWRSDFTSPDPVARQAFLAGRTPRSDREAAALHLEWDLHKLRDMKERMRSAGD